MGQSEQFPTTTNELTIKVINKKVKYKIGNKWATGDIRVSQGNTFKFVGDYAFAIFIGEFVAPPTTSTKPHGWEQDGTRRALFDSTAKPVFSSNSSNELPLTVHASAPPGRHKYTLVTFDDDGNLVSDDPQIIVE